MASMDEDAMFRDITSRIERERQYLDSSIKIRQLSSNNPLAQGNIEVQIRDTRRNIQYLEGRLNELQLRRGVGGMSLNGGQQQPGHQNDHQPSVYGPDDFDHRTSAHSDGGNAALTSPRAPFGPNGPGAPPVKQRPNYSRLDLIKDDSPHLGPRIQLMLSQLQFKLNVEKQYKDGTDKIMSSYRIDGDRKTKQDAEAKRVESIQKIQLLSTALRRYEDLHLDMDTDTPDDDSVNSPTLRKPLTGLLAIRIHAISDVNHAMTGRFSRGPETFVILKVEDDTKGRTRATRTDRWSDEYLEIDIDKGNEIELTVYDKVGGDYPRPIGLLWIPIADIAEEMRRKKIEHDFNQHGWVSADRMDSDGQPRSDLNFNAPPGSQTGAPPAGPGGPPFTQPGAQPTIAPTAIDAWFSLEPYGRIHLSLHFTKQTRERRPFDAGPGGIQRKGAIRQRKEEVRELAGHKFIFQNFYNIMRCAFCGELCKAGMQCSDCNFMCHEKCCYKVFTKCISKSNAESDPDEAKLNHRIPHRFEPFSNITANWCCHCGYMLPFGRKQPRRCKECRTTAHAHCTHLVPDFCGMNMTTAQQMYEQIVQIQKKPKTLRPQAPGPRTSAGSRLAQASEASSATMAESRHSQGGVSFTEGEDSSQPSRPVSGGVLGPAGVPPRRPLPRRDGSSDAAAAATVALASKGSPTEPRPHPQRTSSSQPLSPSKQGQPLPAPPHQPYNPGAYANVDHYAPPQPQPMYTSQPPVQPPQPLAPAAPAQQPDQQRQQPAPAAKPQQPSQSVTKFNEQAAQPAPLATKGRGPRVGLDHFNFLAVLGKGNFGKVMLAETKATKQLYAIKVLKKEFIIEHDEVESTKSERDVFIIANKARHPFLLNLHACFQTETRVYFVMEYISGGDLMLHIQRGQFGTKRAQFYAAEVCLALKHFHENGVVYRDLKLDNILLTLDGHIKIADYGLCKMNMNYGSTTSTFCGTPEFMAPEILLDKKYGRAVDWWAFGVLIYQMLLQQSPFRGEDEDEIYDAILADEPLYPIHMPRDSVSILQKLMTREPELRLGSGPTDAQEIMSHAFFRNINWDDIANKRVQPPFQPQIKSATDTSNFDNEFTSVTPVLTPVQSVLSQAMQEEFRGFSYSADFV